MSLLASFCLIFVTAWSFSFALIWFQFSEKLCHLLQHLIFPTPLLSWFHSAEESLQYILPIPSSPLWICKIVFESQVPSVPFTLSVFYLFFDLVWTRDTASVCGLLFCLPAWICNLMEALWQTLSDLYVKQLFCTVSLVLFPDTVSKPLWSYFLSVYSV